MTLSIPGSLPCIVPTETPVMIMKKYSCLSNKSTVSGCHNAGQNDQPTQNNGCILHNHVNMLYLHGWRLLSECGRLSGILFPSDLKLLCCCGSSCQGFWDRGILGLSLPLCFLFLKVAKTTQSPQQLKPKSH